jgi:hypothetical protein
MAAKQSGGESKTGLVVSLVFFVLTTIILGVATWQGFAGQAEFEKQAKDAKKEADTMKRDREAERVRVAVYKTALGVSDDADVTNLAAKTSSKEAYDRAVASLSPLSESGVNWNQGIDRPTSNVREVLNKFLADTKSAQTDRDAAVAARVLAEQNQAAAVAEKEKEVAVAKEQASASKKQATEALATNSVKYLDAVKSVETTNQELNKTKLDAEAQKTKDTRSINTLTAKGKELEQARDKLLENKNPQNLLDAEKPKGRIVRLDRQRNVAYVNLGSADLVKEQLTFSVLPADAVGKGSLDRPRKGALEIVTVLGDHMSEARITEVVNPNRDPVLQGDLLYNPAWSPSLRQHIAIVGLIDLNGDGQDDTPELVRALEKQGIIVDEYLDLRDLTTKKNGAGMTYTTTYLVMGESPAVGADLTPGRAADRIQNVLNKMADMQVRAKELGVQTISARRFLTVSGFPMPRLTAPADFTSGAYRTAPGAPAAPPAAGPKPEGVPPKTEKKKEEEDKP